MIIEWAPFLTEGRGGFPSHQHENCRSHLFRIGGAFLLRLSSRRRLLLQRGTRDARPPSARGGFLLLRRHFFDDGHFFLNDMRRFFNYRRFFHDGSGLRRLSCSGQLVLDIENWNGGGSRELRPGENSKNPLTIAFQPEQTCTTRSADSLEKIRESVAALVV